MEILSNCCGAKVDGLNADMIGICSECGEGCGVEEVGEEYDHILDSENRQAYSAQEVLDRFILASIYSKVKKIEKALSKLSEQKK